MIKMLHIFLLILFLIPFAIFAQLKEKSRSINNRNFSKPQTSKKDNFSNDVQQEWAAIYNGPSGLSDEATDIVVDSFGNVYVTGYSQGLTGNYDCATIKYDRDGHIQWLRRYDGGFNDYAYALVINDSGNVYVTGSSEGAASGEDYLTIKYNTDGDEQWVKRYNGPRNGYDRAIDIAVDIMGNIYVTGASFGSGTERDFATIKFSPGGVEQWVKRYNGPENSVDEAVALALDNEGNLIVTGESIGLNNRFDYATVKYTAEGVEQWVSRYTSSGNFNDEPYDIAVDDLGNVFVTGSASSIDSSIFDVDYLTIKYNSLGNQRWTARYNGPGNEVDVAYFVGVDDSGNVYITGISVGVGWWFDIATIKYNANGVEQWANRFNSGFVYDLAIDQSGNVYVTGVSSDSTTIGDYTTIKYDTHGLQQWMIRYNGPGNGLDVAQALTLDKTGNVYVTGIVEVQGGIPTFDYTTVKYSQKIVPVELTNLTASVTDNYVILNWQTATEINNSGFEIQRQVSNRQSSIGNWQVIGFRPGSGTTTEPKSYIFEDNGVSYGVYYYRLKQIDFDGSFEYLPDAAGIEVDFNIPIQFALEQNFPNPFNATTIINYTIAEPAQVVLKIYNLLGEEVAELVNETKSIGNHSVEFSASTLPSGVYIYKIQAGSFINSKKMLLLK